MILSNKGNVQFLPPILLHCKYFFIPGFYLRDLQRISGSIIAQYSFFRCCLRHFYCPIAPSARAKWLALSAHRSPRAPQSAVHARRAARLGLGFPQSLALGVLTARAPSTQWLDFDNVAYVNHVQLVVVPGMNESSPLPARLSETVPISFLVTPHTLISPSFTSDERLLDTSLAPLDSRHGFCLGFPRISTVFDFLPVRAKTRLLLNSCGLLMGFFIWWKPPYLQICHCTVTSELGVAFHLFISHH